MKNAVMAFRARMKKRGYTEIHIKHRKKEGTWEITAIEPLAKTTIYAQYSDEAIIGSFRF